jgi:hypothetical protein
MAQIWIELNTKSNLKIYNIKNYNIKNLFIFLST